VGQYLHITCESKPVLLDQNLYIGYMYGAIKNIKLKKSTEQILVGQYLYITRGVKTSFLYKAHSYGPIQTKFDITFEEGQFIYSKQNPGIKTYFQWVKPVLRRHLWTN
jgi:hypothetical protein